MELRTNRPEKRRRKKYKRRNLLLHGDLATVFKESFTTIVATCYRYRASPTIATHICVEIKREERRLKLLEVGLAQLIGCSGRNSRRGAAKVASIGNSDSWPPRDDYDHR